MTTQDEKARAFRALHHGARPLLLPNAWDAASARLFEAAGFDAVATTSAGVAFTLGYPDGERVPREEMLFLARRIVRTVQCPVTLDIEAGYGADSVARTVETVRLAWELGAVGVNLEDRGPDGRLAQPAFQAEKIRAVREAVGPSLFLNARTDAFHPGLHGLDDPLAEAVARARAFLAAGADGVFVPFVTDAAAIARLAGEIDGPLNILALPASPPLDALAEAGVARVSFGAAFCRAALTQTRRFAEAVRATGLCPPDLMAGMTYAEANALFEAVQ